MKKEVIKKKFKVLIKKLKKLLKRIFNYLKNIVVQIWDKFITLPKKIRFLIYVWGGVILLIILFIVVTNSTKIFVKKYENYESTLSEVALNYVKDNGIYATKANKFKLDLETLKDEGYLNSLMIDDDTCEGISVVYYDDFNEEYRAESYLNCDKYTTTNYWDYK